jgi:hypothetical protein
MLMRMLGRRLRLGSWLGWSLRDIEHLAIHPAVDRMQLLNYQYNCVAYEPAIHHARCYARCEFQKELMFLFTR